MLVSFHIPSLLQLLGVCVYVYFLSPQIREELKLTSISAARLAFISSAQSERWEEPEDMKEWESAGEIKEKH